MNRVTNTFLYKTSKTTAPMATTAQGDFVTWLAHVQFPKVAYTTKAERLAALL